jgi:hypothetical protein
MVNSVQGRAALEGRHVIGAAAAQLTVRRHHRALATPRDLHPVRRHMNLQLRIALNNDLM